MFERKEPKKEEKKESKMTPKMKKSVEKKEASKDAKMNPMAQGKKVTLKTTVARKASDLKMSNKK